jgi:hypothetical protein
VEVIGEFISPSDPGRIEARAQKESGKTPVFHGFRGCLLATESPHRFAYYGSDLLNLADEPQFIAFFSGMTG